MPGLLGWWVVAGRKNRGAGRSSGIKADGTWEPAYPGQRPPFGAGNELSVRSGAYSPRVAGVLAGEKLAERLADPLTPARLLVPEMRGELEKLALAEARADLLWLALDDARGAEDAPVPPWLMPRRAGGSVTALGLWHAAQDRVLRLEQSLGLDPASILAEAREAESERALEAMMAAGAEIVARRRQERGET